MSLSQCCHTARNFPPCHVFTDNLVKGIRLGVMRLAMLFTKPRNAINWCSTDYYDSWVTERFYLRKVLQELQKKYLMGNVQFSVTVTHFSVF